MLIIAASKTQTIPGSRAFIAVAYPALIHCGASGPKINYFFNVEIICQLRRIGASRRGRILNRFARILRRQNASGKTAVVVPFARSH
jgi:hypothetical protein